jgi:hypothetical protein
MIPYDISAILCVVALVAGLFIGVGWTWRK